MQISGWIKQSLMDYPGKVASVIFTQGCNFRCPYCHNPELIPLRQGAIPEETVFAHLEKNRFLLDGLVITGGEPTMQPDLCSFIKKVKGLGLSVKLDTNGSNPKILSQLLTEHLIDYVAMDIKSAMTEKDYSPVTGVVFSTKRLDQVRRSVQCIIRSRVEHEFRTTVCRELISFDQIRTILSEIKGAQRYFLQQYYPGEKHNSSENYSSYSMEEMDNFVSQSVGEVMLSVRE
ncbi:MAG: anaerobic ribonucleoside-triphosphate reductase activating protein [Mangrovibacterium sp.]